MSKAEEDAAYITPPATPQFNWDSRCWTVAAHSIAVLGDYWMIRDSISVAKRLSWASARSTTRVEDAAYSMMGLFDINMPTIYGEGPRAFRRLQEEIMRTCPDHSLFTFLTFVAHIPASHAFSILCIFLFWDSIRTPTYFALHSKDPYVPPVLDLSCSAHPPRSV